MAGRKANPLPEVDLKKLSPQQALIYKMAGSGLTYTEIAQELGMKVSQVTSQVNRIKKKALELSNAYKSKDGAEHAQKQVINSKTDVKSPAEELKHLLQHDTGFLRLMRSRYGSDEKPGKENSMQLAVLTKDKNIRISRARRIKMLSVSGKNGKIVLRLTSEQKRNAAGYLKERHISPLEFFWDDKSSTYIVDGKELAGLEKALETGE